MDLKKLDFIVQTIQESSKNSKESALQILDIGCGKGGVSFALASLGYNVLGIDLDKDAVHFLNNANLFPNATFAFGDAERLNLDKKFDIVICSEILEHLDYPQLLIGSIKRHLKEKGIAIVTIPNGYGPWELLFDLPMRLALYIFHRTTNKQPNRGAQHVQNFSMRRFKKLCSTVGRLHITRIGHSDFVSGFPMLRRSRISICDLMIADRLPHFLVSGWFFVLTSSDATEARGTK